MKKDRIHLFDTTLRDGQQTPGIDFSVDDKIAAAGFRFARVDALVDGHPEAEGKRGRTAVSQGYVAPVARDNALRIGDHSRALGVFR